MMMMFVTGGFAWLGLYQYRRLLRLPRWNAILVLVLALLTFARHVDERRRSAAKSAIRRSASPRSTPANRPARHASSAISSGDTPEAWIVSETLHFVGLSMIIGVLLLINLPHRSGSSRRSRSARSIGCCRGR